MQQINSKKLAVALAVALHKEPLRTVVVYHTFVESLAPLRIAFGREHLVHGARKIVEMGAIEVFVSIKFILRNPVHRYPVVNSVVIRRNFISLDFGNTLPGGGGKVLEFGSSDTRNNHAEVAVNIV